MQILYDMDEKLIRLQKLVQMGKALKVKRLAEDLLEEEPGLPEAHMALGNMYEFHMQDYARAASCYTMAIHFNDQLAVAWYALMRVQFYISDHMALLHTCERALLITCVYKTIVYKHMALCHEEQLHLKRAQRCYELAQLYAMSDNDVDENKRSVQRIKAKLDIKRE